jgi:hypothetical protein
VFLGKADGCLTRQAKARERSVNLEIEAGGSKTISPQGCREISWRPDPYPEFASCFGKPGPGSKIAHHRDLKLSTAALHALDVTEPQSSPASVPRSSPNPCVILLISGWWPPVTHLGPGWWLGRVPDLISIPTGDSLIHQQTVRGVSAKNSPPKTTYQSGHNKSTICQFPVFLPFSQPKCLHIKYTRTFRRFNSGTWGSSVISLFHLNIEQFPPSRRQSSVSARNHLSLVYIQRLTLKNTQI